MRTTPLLLAAALAALPALTSAARAQAPDDEDVETRSALTQEEKAQALAVPDAFGSAAADTGLQRLSEALLHGKGKWAFEFVYVRSDGSSTVLSQLNETLPVIPASTMKLFIGWMAYSQGLEPAEYLTHMLRRSDNAQAERALAAAGGVAALRRFLTGLELPLDGFKAVDGSGLSARDRVTAGLQVALLETILRASGYEGFRSCLAQPREPSTLMNEGRLQELTGLYAKTGTLGRTGVYSLAGYLEGKKGTLVFSVIGNSVTASTSQAREAIDAVVRLHAAAMEAVERPPLRLAGLRLEAPRF